MVLRVAEESYRKCIKGLKKRIVFMYDLPVWFFEAVKMHTGCMECISARVLCQLWWQQAMVLLVWWLPFGRLPVVRGWQR